MLVAAEEEAEEEARGEGDFEEMEIDGTAFAGVVGEEGFTGLSCNASGHARS